MGGGEETPNTDAMSIRRIVRDLQMCQHLLDDQTLILEHVKQCPLIFIVRRMHWCLFGAIRLGLVCYASTD